MNPSGRTWRAILWAEGFLILGLIAVVFSVMSAFQSCDLFIGGCGPGESSVEAETVVWLVIAAVAVATGVIVAARASGWSRGRAAAHATLALGAGAVALWLGGRAFVGLVGEFLPALVLAVGVAGTIAIRPSSARAVTARVIALVVLAAVALGLANDGIAVIGLALLTLPAIGAAESVVAGRRE